NEKGDLRRFVKKITVRQGLLAIPAVIILLLFAPGMFRVFLGEKWYEAGIYAQIFAPSVFMHFIVSPISYIPIIVNRQKTAFIIGLASNLLDIAAVVSGSYIGNDVKTGFYILTFVRLVTLILTLIWYYKISASIKGGTEAKSKSSKDKADIKVKLPKDELEIETNKIKYKMKIIIIGLPYFACRLAKSLSHFDRDNSYVAIDMNRGILSKLKYIFHLINADIVYSIGGFVVYSRSAAMAFLLKKKFIMEWVGSDVLNARRAYKENLVDMKIIQQSIHFCEAPWIQKDLAQLGIKTEILYFFTFNTEERQIYKLPDKFSILSYVNESRQEFYGIDNLIRLARDFPKIEVRIAGMKTTQKELPQNIKLLGWVKDMGEFYKGCVLFLRLTEHDGLAFSVREALGVGRYVGYSYKYDKTFFVDSYSSLKSLVLELCRSFYNNSLVFNYNGMDFIAKTFSEKKVLGNLVNKFKKIIEN
ncbi:MAG TPA: hypothetical protein PK733_16675, partial [Clostridiales bacterium]|nr:hypothetical protein [Clostridiales bacterium]